MVFEHQGEYRSQWKAICSIGEQLGVHHESLRVWVRRAEVDEGRRLFEDHGRIPPAEFEANHYRQRDSGREAETHTREPA
jgi:transposase-like protein